VLCVVEELAAWGVKGRGFQLSYETDGVGKLFEVMKGVDGGCCGGGRGEGWGNTLGCGSGRGEEMDLLLKPAPGIVMPAIISCCGRYLLSLIRFLLLLFFV